MAEYEPDPYAGQLDKKSISFANKNPLNLRPGGGQWVGMVGVKVHKRAGAFVVFDTVENGYRAAAITLINYARLYGADTLRKIIARWAPDADGNDSNLYAVKVGQEIGMPLDTPLELERRPELLVALMWAMTRVEAGGIAPPYRVATLKEGVRRAYRRFLKEAFA